MTAALPPASELSALLADRVDSVVPSLLPNARRAGGYWNIGSVAGEAGKSLFILREGPRAGKWEDAATGQHGDLLDLAGSVLRTDFLGALEWARGYLGISTEETKSTVATPSPATPEQQHDVDHERGVDHDQEDRRRIAWARGIWTSAKPIAGTDAETYLRWRSIALDLPPTLRHHGALKHSPTGQLFPCLVAAVSGPDGKVQAIQRTFLKVGGAGKAGVSEPRLSLGPLGEGAVRLGPAAETLGLGEGVETCLSAMEMFKIPVWATLGTGRLHRVALPDIVRHIIIFADNGGPGIKAANRAIAAYTAQRRKVTLRFPPREFPDFNDALEAVAKESAA